MTTHNINHNFPLDHRDSLINLMTVIRNNFKLNYDMLWLLKIQIHSNLNKVWLTTYN